MAVKWQPENAEGTLWPATVADVSRVSSRSKRSAVPMAGTGSSNDRRFWGQESTLEQAKIAVAAQLKQTGQHFRRCEIRPITENEGDGYLISFPDFSGVVASGAMPEEVNPVGA